jgi:hypothetical protein
MIKERKSKADAEKMLLEQIKPEHPEVLAVVMRRSSSRRWEFGFVREGRVSGRADHAARQLLMKLEERFEIAGD